MTTLAVVMTPPLLQWAAPEEDWDELSKISQSYSALSVIFSALALLGVAMSLSYQAHQTAIANEESQRAGHRQLLLQSLDDPVLAVCWEPLSETISLQERKQVAYVNLLVSDRDADYRLKRTNDDAVRVLAELHFRGEAARRHWHLASSNWRRFAEASGDRRAVRFVQLMDEVYAQSVAAGPPIASASYYSPTS
ncbi:DUF6082 family protein [Streptomyces griseoincarnatus]